MNYYIKFLDFFSKEKVGELFCTEDDYANITSFVGDFDHYNKIDFRYKNPEAKEHPYAPSHINVPCYLYKAIVKSQFDKSCEVTVMVLKTRRLGDFYRYMRLKRVKEERKTYTETVMDFVT